MHKVVNRPLEGDGHAADPPPSLSAPALRISVIALHVHAQSDGEEMHLTVLSHEVGDSCGSARGA